MPDPRDPRGVRHRLAVVLALTTCGVCQTSGVTVGGWGYCNAAYRRYRVQQMRFLWHVHHDDVTDKTREALEEARRAHHVAFAEAQMIASSPVLDRLDVVTKALSEVYRKTLCLYEGNPDPDGSFDDIESHLHWLWDRWAEMHGVMRADLGSTTATLFDDSPARVRWSPPSVTVADRRRRRLLGVGCAAGFRATPHSIVAPRPGAGCCRVGV